MSSAGIILAYSLPDLTLENIKKEYSINVKSNNFEFPDIYRTYSFVPQTISNSVTSLKWIKAVIYF